MSGLILHRAFGSPPARAVMMLAETLGLQLQFKEVQLLHLEQKTPEYKKLNPMGTVPVLQDGDFVLSESHAIMKYIISRYGGDKGEALYPSEVRRRAIVDQCLFFNAGVLFPAMGQVAMSALYDGLKAPTDLHIKRIDSAYSVIEAYLENRKYIATDHLTIADIAAGATATAAQLLHKIDKNKYERAVDWVARLEDEHIFKTVNAPGVAYLNKVFTKIWKLNNTKDS